MRINKINFNTPVRVFSNVKKNKTQAQKTSNPIQEGISPSYYNALNFGARLTKSEEVKKDFLDKFYYKTPDRIQTKTNEDEENFKYMVEPMLELLKDKKGDYNKTNEEFLCNLLTQDIRFINNEQFRFINEIKDENGVVKEDAANFALYATKYVEPHLISGVVSEYNDLPEDKAGDILNRALETFDDNHKALMNLEDFYSACYKDGEPVEENIDFLKTACAFEPEDSFSIFTKRCFGKDKTVSQARKKLLEFLEEDKSIYHFNICYDLCSSSKEFDEKLFKQAKILFNANSGIKLPQNREVLETIKKTKEKGYSPKLDERIKHIEILKGLDENLQKELGIKGHIANLESFFEAKIINPIDEKTRIQFIHEVLASNETLTPFETVICQSIEKLKEFNQGLPLLYQRKDFLSDLNKLNLDKDIFDKLQIEENLPYSYEGFINLENLDITNEKEEKVYDLCRKFLYENEIQTGDNELDSELNKIIKAIPEFINIIGKTQHDTHDYTLDIHSLLVLANSIKNPDYSKLTLSDKAALKLSAIVHDITKKEGSRDKEHPLSSSLSAKNICLKFYKTPAAQDRIYNLVKNHHWLERLETAYFKEWEAEKIAFEFRHKNDFQIAKIFACADLKSVSDDFYKEYKSSLSDAELVEEAINEIYSSANAIFTTFPTRQGYSVIDTHKIGDDEDLYDYGFGFERGIKKEDLMLLVHMVSENNITQSLNNLKELTSQKTQSALSESIITPKKKATYYDRKFGVILSQDNADVINFDKQNQCSGYKKDSDKARCLIESEERKNFKRAILKELQVECSDKEYAEFYKEIILPKTAFCQFKPDKTFELGGKTFSEEDLKEAIYKFQKSLLKEREHNEIVGCTPKIRGVIAKVKSADEVPCELLEFAKKENLPVVLI